MQAPVLPVAVVRDADRELEVPLVVDVLQRDGRGRLEPPVFFRLQPVVQALLELVELLHWRAPGDLHRQVLGRLVAPPGVRAGEERKG